MNIKLVRMVTGEDVLTELKDNETHYTFTNPLMIFMQPSASGNMPTVGMHQWIPYSSDKKYDVPREKVVMICNPAEDLRAQYDKAFGSGLIIPKTLLTS